MRKNFGAKTWLYPMPVLIVGTYDENGNPNAMNAAWGRIYDTNQVMICLSDDHRTTENIKKTGAFTVSFATAKMPTTTPMPNGISTPQQRRTALILPESSASTNPLTEPTTGL